MIAIVVIGLVIMGVAWAWLSRIFNLDYQALWAGLLFIFGLYLLIIGGYGEK